MKARPDAAWFLKTESRLVGSGCTGSPFRILFGSRAATRLNGPSVHDGALLTQRYVRAVEGEKERERVGRRER